MNYIFKDLLENQSFCFIIKLSNFYFFSILKIYHFWGISKQNLIEYKSKTNHQLLVWRSLSKSEQIWTISHEFLFGQWIHFSQFPTNCNSLCPMWKIVCFILWKQSTLITILFSSWNLELRSKKKKLRFLDFFQDRSYINIMLLTIAIIYLKIG